MLPETNIFVNEGEDPTRLIIAFTGFKGKLMMQPYDFFSITGMLG